LPPQRMRVRHRPSNRDVARERLTGPPGEPATWRTLRAAPALRAFATPAHWPVHYVAAGNPVTRAALRPYSSTSGRRTALSSLSRNASHDGGFRPANES